MVCSTFLRQCAPCLNFRYLFLLLLLLPPPLLLLLPLLLLQVVTDVPWSPSAAAPHPLYNLHRYLGVVAIALTLLQVRCVTYFNCVTLMLHVCYLVVAL
jgi:hypothetical protein